MNIFYQAMGIVVLWVFPAIILLHTIYLWGRGECVMMVLSKWLAGM